MISTLIFDLDGLLSDTEKLHRQAYQEVLAGFGVALSDREYEEHWIRDGKGIGEFAADFRLSLDIDAVRRGKAKRYDELVRSQVEPMPGALQVLERMRAHKTLALATASYYESAMAVLETLRMKEYFSCIGTKANAERAKPFPDIFLWVASTLDVSPEECLVLEDSGKGVAAACAAGMRSIAVPNRYTAAHDFSKAGTVLNSLDEVTLDLVDRQT